MTIMASIIKRCDCDDWDKCPHPWIVRYRTEGGRSSRQREQSFGDDLKEDGYLFQGRGHKHVTRRTYNEDFERAAGKAALAAGVHPPSLRHCYASTALAHSIPITEVSRRLGHKSIEVTHQIYGHLVPASWDRARTVLDDARRAGRHQPPAGDRP